MKCKTPTNRRHLEFLSIIALLCSALTIPASPLHYVFPVIFQQSFCYCARVPSAPPFLILLEKAFQWSELQDQGRRYQKSRGQLLCYRATADTHDIPVSEIPEGNAFIIQVLIMFIATGTGFAQSN